MVTFHEPIKIMKKDDIFNSEDIEVVKTNHVDLTDQDKNNYIIKIRKMMLYFENDAKHLIVMLSKCYVLQ